MSKADRYQQRMMDRINGHHIERSSGVSIRDIRDRDYVAKEERRKAKMAEKNRRRQEAEDAAVSKELLDSNPIFGMF